MASVQHVVDRVGPTLLRILHLPASCPAVGDVVIAEPGAHPSPGDLVLGVATADQQDCVRVLRESAERGAAAVLLKPPFAARAQVRRAAAAADIALVEVRAATSWAQLVWLLRTVLDALADESDDLGDGAGDLFRLADAVAGLVDAPVTIEDINSRVLAYSARQDLTDPARVSTIMGRRIPDDVLTRFRSRGVFRELSRGRQTIFVPAQQDGTLPRLIVPIRMGGELLGSMWAVVDGPVSEERAAAFADAAPVVALRLLRHRAHADAGRRASAELVRLLLEGKGNARRTSTELGLTDEPHRVVVLDVGNRDTPDGEALRLSLLDRIYSGVGRQPVAAEIAGQLYAIVPDSDSGTGWAALRRALAELPRRGTIAGLCAAAGAAHGTDSLADSRAEAEESLGLLRAGLASGAVIAFDEVWTSLALHRAAAGGAHAAEVGPLRALLDHDAANGTRYTETLYHWLRHPGDPRAAATALRIHPNTLRYRIRKVLDILDVDPEDPDVRLALTVQLVALNWS